MDADSPPAPAPIRSADHQAGAGGPGTGMQLLSCATGELTRSASTVSILLHPRKRKPAAIATNELHSTPHNSGRQGIHRAGRPGTSE